VRRRFSLVISFRTVFGLGNSLRQTYSSSPEPPFDQDGDPRRLGIGNFPGHPSDLAAGLGPLAGFPTCEP